MVQITIEQLGDLLNDYRQDVRRAVGHAQPLSVSKERMEAAKEKLKQKLEPFELAQMIDWREGPGV